MPRLPLMRFVDTGLAWELKQAQYHNQCPVHGMRTCLAAGPGASQATQAASPLQVPAIHQSCHSLWRPAGVWCVAHPFTAPARQTCWALFTKHSVVLISASISIASALLGVTAMHTVLSMWSAAHMDGCTCVALPAVGLLRLQPHAHNAMQGQCVDAL